MRELVFDIMPQDMPEQEQAPAAPLYTLEHAPGIYFGMPDDEYHAIPALSASGIRNMMVSPMDFWARSWMNQNREEEQSEFMLMGKALHSRICEGREEFYKRFSPEFDGSQYADALRTSDDIKEVLKDLGLKSSGKKDELSARLREADPSIKILDDIKAEYAALHEGKTFLKQKFMNQLEVAAAMIEKHPDLSRCFSGGMPEVSVIWYDKETGVPMKGRMDYLKTQAIVDLKTFSNSQGKPVDKAIYASMAAGKYHVQMAVYTEANKQAVEHARAGRVFGDVDKDWLNKYASVEDRAFVFVFLQTGVAPVARGRKFEKNLAYECGVLAMRDGIQQFLDCYKAYGADPWVDVSPIESFDDSGFPVYMFEK